MVRKRGWLVAALMIGCLWGMTEVAMDASFAWSGGPARAVVLPTVAVLLLGVLYALEGKPAAILVAGGVAAFFKLLNVPFFACQIFAVLLLVVLLAVVVWAQVPVLRVGRNRLPVLVGMAVWAFFLLFALTMTYVAHNRWWVMGGLPRVANYVVLQGAVAALLSIGAFVLGQKVGTALRQGWVHLLAYRPAYCCAGLAVLMAAASAVSLGM